MLGAALTHWTIRLALLCMVGRFAGDLLWAGRPRWNSASRLLWTIGCVLFLLHVASAFHFYHQWSHAHALEVTAERTYEMLGVRFGEGIYFSYLFTLLWAADVAWLWSRSISQQNRSAWLTMLLLSYMAFIAFNGAVVFEGGTTRLVGIPLTAALAALAVVAWYRRRRERNLTVDHH